MQISMAIFLEENAGMQIGGAISLGFGVVNGLLARVWRRESAFCSGRPSWACVSLELGVENRLITRVWRRESAYRSGFAS